MINHEMFLNYSCMPYLLSHLYLHVDLMFSTKELVDQDENIDLLKKCGYLNNEVS